MGQKICVSDGNAIELRWPLFVVDEPENNERGAGAEGGNSNFEFYPRQENVWLQKLTELSQK